MANIKALLVGRGPGSGLAHLLLRCAISAALGGTFPCHAATPDDWSGGAGAANPYWDLAANWTAGVPANSTNSVLIGSSANPIHRSGTDSIASLSDSGSLTVSGGSLTVTGTSTVSTNGTYISL